MKSEIYTASSMGQIKCYWYVLVVVTVNPKLLFYFDANSTKLGALPITLAC